MGYVDVGCAEPETDLLVDIRGDYVEL